MYIYFVYEISTRVIIGVFLDEDAAIDLVKNIELDCNYIAVKKEGIRALDAYKIQSQTKFF